MEVRTAYYKPCGDIASAYMLVNAASCDDWKKQLDLFIKLFTAELGCHLVLGRTMAIQHYSTTIVACMWNEL